MLIHTSLFLCISMTSSFAGQLLSAGYEFIHSLSHTYLSSLFIVDSKAVVHTTDSPLILDLFVSWLIYFNQQINGKEQKECKFFTSRGKCFGLVCCTVNLNLRESDKSVRAQIKTQSKGDNPCTKLATNQTEVTSIIKKPRQSNTVVFEVIIIKTADFHLYWIYRK